MEPEPIPGTDLGDDLNFLRDQHPQTAFTMGPIRMNFTQVEGSTITWRSTGMENFVCQTIC